MQAIKMKIDFVMTKKQQKGPLGSLQDNYFFSEVAILPVIAVHIIFRKNCKGIV
jgi:hypothetical protein